MFNKFSIFIFLLTFMSFQVIAEPEFEEEEGVDEPIDGIEIFHEEDEALAHVNFTNIIYQENHYERSRHQS